MLNHWRALAGGTLIGLPSAIMLVVKGRVAGISGITGAMLTRWAADNSWRTAGFRPGPAIAALSVGLPKAFAFVLAMLAGMGCFGMFDARGRRREDHTAVTEPSRG